MTYLSEDKHQMKPPHSYSDETVCYPYRGNQMNLLSDTVRLSVNSGLTTFLGSMTLAKNNIYWDITI